MYQLLIVVALLSATPAVAQWTVSTYAGAAAPFDSFAPFNAPVGLALNPTGSFYFTTSNAIWRVRAGGAAERFAGTGTSGYGGDGGPATAALLNFPFDPQADAAGNVYFWDANNVRIRRISTNGIITTVAGTGVPWVTGMDREGPATLRSLPNANDFKRFAVKTSGDVYFSDQQGSGGAYQIRRVTTAGQLQVVAGTDNCPVCLDGDSVPAVLAHLKGPGIMVFDNRDNLYVVEVIQLDPRSNFSGSSTVRRISPDGLMTRIAGCTVLPCGPFGDGQPALNQNFFIIEALAVDDLGNLYFSNLPPIYVSVFLRRMGTDGLMQTIAFLDRTVPTQDLENLYVDSSGRIVYRVGYTLRDVRDGSVTTAIPSDVSVFVPTPDGTAAQDVPLPSSYFMAVSHAGELHYTDGCEVRKFDRNGILRTVASWCQGLIYYVSTIAFDGQDRLWVRALRSGANNYSTFIVPPGGQPVEQTLPQYLGSESIIAVDSQGRLFRMSSSALNRVEADGTVRQIGPPNNGVFAAIGTDPQGNVFFSDGSSVYLVNNDGSFTKFFGDVTYGDGVNGTALFVDPAGRLWERLNFTTQAGNFRLGLGASCVPGQSSGSTEGILVQTSRFCQIQQSVQAPDGSIYLAEGFRIHKTTSILRAATPVISAGGIVNSASYSGGPIAPGELISIFGFNFGPAAGSVEVAQASNNMLATALKRTKVFFTVPSRFPIEGAIAAATPTQINVFVPYDALHAATAGLVDIVVMVDDATSLPMRMPVAERAIDLFSMDSSGSRQGAILNQDQSLNGPGNPAARGTIVSLWGTGEGKPSPQLPDGALVISTPYPKPTAAVTARIGGVDAEVLYAGSAPTLPTGAFQVNARVPLGIPAGNASVSVSVGSSTTTRSVTVAVQ